MCVYACMYVKRKKYFACVQLCRAKLVWPDYIQSSGNTGKDCFRKNAEFSCSASECLSLYGPTRHFLRTLNLDRSEDASVRLTVRSLVLALNLLELCHSSMRGPISSDTLHKYVVDHLKAFKLAQGEESVLPKHHYMLHVAQSMRETGYLLNCFVLERKHKGIKLYANNRHTVSPDWSKQLLEQVTLSYCQRLAEHEEPLEHDAVFLAGAVQDAPAEINQSFQDDFPGSAPVMTALGASVCGNMIKRDDVVTFATDTGQTAHGQVMYHCESSGHLVSIISVWESLSKHQFRCGDSVLRWVETRRIKGSVIYQPLPDNSALVIPHAV